MTELAVQARYSDSDLNRDLLSVTAFFSVLIHATLILAVTFEFPEIASRTNTDNTLEVILLSQNNELEVEDAELISSNDNLGGGDDAEEGSTNLPWEQVEPSPINSIEKHADQTPINTISPDQFISATSSSVSLQRQTPTPTKLKNQRATAGTDLINTDARQLQRERLIAKLRQSQEDYRKRPRKKFHSPTTKASGAANYLAAWKKKVVRQGNANYPIEVRAKELSGSLTLTVEIRRDGMIHDIFVNSSSKHKLLDESAMRIIRDAAPFQTFPENDYFEGVDILTITRMIHFLPDSSFDSTAAGG